MPAAKRSIRTRELAAIHTLKSKLKMGDDAYRAMLAEVAGVRSAADLTSSADRQRVIGHLRDIERRMGLAGDRPRRQPTRRRRGADMGFRDDDSPREKKVRMMWLALAEAGEVEAATEAAMNKWVKRQFGVASLNWFESAGKINDCIEQLKQWHQRVGL